MCPQCREDELLCELSNHISVISIPRARAIHPLQLRSHPCSARLVRVMNVLRGYRHDDVAPFGQHVWEGLEEERPALEEGSCDPNGAMGGVHVMRRWGRGLEREALFLFTDFSREGISPMQFRDWLPRDLRRSTSRHADGGHPLISFLSLWRSAWLVSGGSCCGRQRSPSSFSSFFFLSK